MANTDAIRFYDRALQRCPGASCSTSPGSSALAAIAAAAAVARRRLRSRSFRTYPFPLGVASGDPWPTSVVLWTRLAPEPLDGGGMPMANVEVGWEIARDRALPHDRPRRAPRSRGRSSGTACTSKPTASSRAANTAIASAPAARSARSAAPRPRRPPARRSIGCASPSCGCSHYETGYFTAYRRIADGAVRLRLPHRRLHLRRPRRWRPQSGHRAAAPRARDLHARRLPQPLRAVQDRIRT